MKILLVEDDLLLSGEIAAALRRENFAVDTAADGEEGHYLGDTETYDAAVLDLGLPKMPGAAVLRAWRKGGRQLPVLILTARDGWTEKVDGFKAGADDYLTKPFALPELMVRVRALMRRGPAIKDTMLKMADLEVDRLSRQVRRAGRRVELSPKEYSLLEYLLLNAGRVVSRSMIIDRVWDQSFEGFTNIVDVYVRQLRRKMDEGFDPKLIRTVRGLGYSIDPEHTGG
jgi:DNA-binding response OmpR family regulator